MCRDVYWFLFGYVAGGWYVRLGERERHETDEGQEVSGHAGDDATGANIR